MGNENRSNPGKPKESFDISDLLQEADRENEKDIAKADERQKTKELEKTLFADTIVVDRTEKKDEPAKRRNLDAETIELIDRYSTREIKDEKSNTQELRESLAKKLEDEKLRGYLEGKPQSQAKKVDDVRTRILSPDALLDNEEPETRKKSPVRSERIERDVSARFSDDDGEPEPTFEQAEMFPLGDTMTIREKERETQYADYDRDYQDLGSRVIAGGIPESDRDDGQLSFISDGADVPSLVPGSDPTDDNLRMAFERMADGDYSMDPARAQMILKSRRKHKKVTDLIFEYTSRTQNPELSGKLRAAKRGSIVRLLLALFVTGIVCLMEFGPLFGFLLKSGDVNTGARMYILIDLQLVFFCAMTILPSVIKGLKGMFTFKMNADSMLVFGLIFDAAYTVICVIRGPEIDRLGLYGSALCFGCVCSAFSSVLRSAKDERIFGIISKDRLKYVAEKLPSSVRESEEFGHYMSDDSEMYTVKRTGFVDGFAERTVRRSRNDDLFHVIMPLILFGGVAVFAALLIIGRPLSEAFRAFYALVAVSIPSTAFFMLVLPLYIANRRGGKYSAAFVGNAVAEEYENARVLSFADTEVFPANLVKLNSINTYSDYRIDKIIPELAKIFSFLGGPLASVTARMVDGPFEKYESARVIENAADGICVAVDGKHIFLGKRTFLQRYRFSAPAEPGDEAFERNSGSVMYVVIDEQLAAKVYIRYRINPRFETLLRDLYRAGLCLGIKTMDPNITNDLIAGLIKFRKCPVSVLKQNHPRDISGESAHASSGIVCNSSLHNFLKMFALNDKIHHVGKCNEIITVISVVLSFVAVAFLAITEDLQAFGVLQALIFQLCWQIPVWALSFAMIR